MVNLQFKLPRVHSLCCRLMSMSELGSRRNMEYPVWLQLDNGDWWSSLRSFETIIQPCPLHAADSLLVALQLLWVEAADLEDSPPPEKAAAAEVSCLMDSLGSPPHSSDLRV